MWRHLVISFLLRMRACKKWPRHTERWQVSKSPTWTFTWQSVHYACTMVTNVPHAYKQTMVHPVDKFVESRCEKQCSLAHDFLKHDVSSCATAFASTVVRCVISTGLFVRNWHLFKDSRKIMRCGRYCFSGNKYEKRAQKEVDRRLQKNLIHPPVCFSGSN